MNRTFKVVFNKARGALMVANEATCSVQKKGVKTAIAVAAALAMGSSMAQGWIDAPSKEEGAVVLENESVSSEDFEGKSQFSYTLTEGKLSGFHSATGEISADKSVWVTATGGKDAKAHAYSVDGADKQLTNHGRIYIQAGKNEKGGLLANSYSQKGMIAGKGATAINARDGLIVAKNAYGMTVETTGPASKVQNDGQIVVLEQGVGIELGGAKGSSAENRGTITVSDIVDHGGENNYWGHGVLIKDSSDNVFTNYGTIKASGEGATAIEIQVSSNKTTSGNVINLEKGSSISGLIHNHAGVAGTVLNANGFVGEIDLKNESTSGMTINVDQGAELTLADGHGSQDLTAVVKDGTLTASIWQNYEDAEGKPASDNKFKSVRVEKDGIFNVTKLNSGGDKGNLAEDPHTTLLIKGADWTLAGGELQVGGKTFTNSLKVGTSSDTSSLTIESGAYSFDSLELGKQGKTTVKGDLTVGNLTLTDAHVANDNRAHVLVTDTGSLTLNGKLSAQGNYQAVDGKTGVYVEGNLILGSEAELDIKEGTLTIEGELTAAQNQIFKATEDEGDMTYTLADGVKKIDFKEDAGLLLSDDLSMSQEDFKALLGKLQGNWKNAPEIVFTNVALTGDVTFDTELGYNGLNTEVDAGKTVDGTVTLKADDDVAVGALKVEAGTETVSITEQNDKEFVFAGLGGNVITGVDSVKTINAADGEITLGWDENSKGVVNATDVVAKKVTVIGDFTMTNLTVGQQLDVDSGASLTLDKLEGHGKASIEGTMTANVIAAAAQVENGGVLLIGARQEATTEEEPPVEGGAEVGTQMLILARVGDETGTPEAEPTYVNQVQDVVTGRIGSVTTTSAGGIAALAAAGFDSATQAGLYVDHTIGVDDATGRLEIGLTQEQGAATSAGGVQLTSDAFTVINVGALNGEAAFSANQMTNNGQIVLDNITGLGQVTLISGTTNVGGTGTVTTTSALYNAAVNAEAGNVFDIGYNTGVAGDIDGVVEGLVTNGTDVKNMNVLNAIANKNSGYVGSDGKLTSTGVQATKEYLATPVTAGTYNMAYDSAELISNALIQHNLNSKQGLGVWADVFYGSNETDTLYGNSGYSSDIYGGMIGVDYGFGEGARVGAALSIGSGDGDSEGSVSKYSTDSDFWGLSVYAGKDVGGLTFTADMSYLWLDNDISGSVAGASASESLDSTVFTLGARADWKAYEGDVMQVVPHVGVRWAQIDVDDYRGLSMDKMNVFEMPIGVTVKGNIATASGWTVTPAIDFTAAPQIGDTEVETIVGDVDVIDNVYNASIGVSAGNDAMRFGLSYKYGFGNDGRSNNTFNLKASYLF